MQVSVGCRHRHRGRLLNKTNRKGLLNLKINNCFPRDRILQGAKSYVADSDNIGMSYDYDVFKQRLSMYNSCVSRSLSISGRWCFPFYLTSDSSLFYLSLLHPTPSFKHFIATTSFSTAITMESYEKLWWKETIGIKERECERKWEKQVK